jgi:Fur family ferric uptake transcriptional regulator
MEHQHSHRPPLPELADRLRRQARKLTGPRQAVLEVLRLQAHPMSIKEIFVALPSGLCDLATVYRSLGLLESLSMVKRYDLGDGIARFELLNEGDDGHHHHLVCTRCSEVVEIRDCAMEDLDSKVAASNGFASVTHKLEFFGICPACQRG